MNPLAIVMTVGAAAGLAAIIGYFAYQAFNVNEPHKLNHTRSHAASTKKSQSAPNSCYVGQCSICLKRIEFSKRKTLSCYHMFHRVCIDEWKAQREGNELNCPDCSICTICLEEVEKPQTTLKCKHVFHKECIEEWLKTERKCPNCKKHV